jgi:hypothetical protein
VDEETVRQWPPDPGEDRCPVCLVPPGAWHLADECIYSGLWHGPVKPPDVAGDSDAAAPATRVPRPDAVHDHSGCDPES